MQRRRFIKLCAFSCAAGIGLTHCQLKKHSITGSITGSSSSVGHLLRDGTLNYKPSTIEQVDTLIIGGGVSGLSAARFLSLAGKNDYLLLELENDLGGNARMGQNEISAYPLGAHYLPIANNYLSEYINFLKEADVITGFTSSGLPIYNDLHLCFDSQERLFLNGRWQEGIIPTTGISSEDHNEIKRFLSMMEMFRTKRGNDGKFAFDIPVDNSSKDIFYTHLDNITFNEWLHKNGFHSPYLHWYTNYATVDDFGCESKDISAWVGIHYFAARKGIGSNASHGDVLTWPEGNGFAVNVLRSHLKGKSKTGALAFAVERKTNTVSYFDTKLKSIHAIKAKHIILAVPQFIAARLLNDEARLEIVHRSFQYTPWVIANIRLDSSLEKVGGLMSWDNVLYESSSLGYVDATHQLLNQQLPEKNITYYLPFASGNASVARKKIHQYSHADWCNIVVDDLLKAHPNLKDFIKHIDITIHGHAMVKPLPGIAHGSLRHQLGTSIGSIHFAHSDIAGISIFEEAFYKGIQAAKNVLA